MTQTLRYADRRRSPLIKRLAAAALMILFLGLLADVHLLARQANRRIVQLERQQRQAVAGLIAIRDAIAAGKPLTVEQVQQLLDQVQQPPGPQGPRGGRGPRGPAGPTGPTLPTALPPSSTSSTSSSSTTTTTRCVVRINPICVRGGP
jgi:hypothetical protein